MPELEARQELKWLGVIALLLLVYLATVARGINWPNDYSEAHWFMSYEFGFIKRGFIGTGFDLLQWLFPHIATETLLHTVAGFFLAIWYMVYFALVVLLVRKFNYSLAAILVGLIFVSSPYIVMTGKVNGYYDNIIAMLTVLALLVIHRGGGGTDPRQLYCGRVVRSWRTNS